MVPASDVLPYVLDNLSKDQVCTSQSETEFELVHSLDSLSSLQADALDLPGMTALRMHVKLPSAIYYGGKHQPAVVIKRYACRTTYSEHPYGAILSQLNKICEAFFADNWPCQNQHETLNFLPNLYRHVQTRIPLLGTFCVVCGCQQEQVVLRPLPCNSEACNVAFNKHGTGYTGADLRDIYSRPVIADLLISMASAACQCITRRGYLLQCIPSNLFPKIQGHVFRCVCKLFITKVSQQIAVTDWQRMKKAFQCLPSVRAMAKQPSLQDFLISKNPQTGLMTFRLLRWILNSCQVHLMQLQEEDRFPMMATEYQFRLCSDCPSKEATFSQLKEQYGSRFLFHGSSFYNWPSILQKGLQDMSCASLTSGVHSHNNGIWLAENSSVSAGFCDYRDSCAISAYKGSIFGKSPLCMALCEVINEYSTSRIQSDVRIEMDPNKVIARYLFVFQSNSNIPDSPVAAIPSIQAGALCEMCDKHAKTQAATLDSVKKALQDL